MVAVAAATCVERDNVGTATTEARHVELRRFVARSNGEMGGQLSWNGVSNRRVRMYVQTGGTGTEDQVNSQVTPLPEFRRRECYYVVGERIDGTTGEFVVPRACVVDGRHTTGRQSTAWVYVGVSPDGLCEGVMDSFKRRVGMVVTELLTNATTTLHVNMTVLVDTTTDDETWWYTLVWMVSTLVILCWLCCRREEECTCGRCRRCTHQTSLHYVKVTWDEHGI